MNRLRHKEIKIKAGRPRCAYRIAASDVGLSKYFDAAGVERWVSSGNRTDTKKFWETNKRRSLGIAPPPPKSSSEVISAKNVANVQRWRSENPEKTAAQRAKSVFIRRSSVRSRKMEPVTAAFLAQQRMRQNDQCVYCGVPLLNGGHKDHVIPVSAGGAHAPHNIVWACVRCNLKKGSKLGWVPLRTR